MHNFFVSDEVIFRHKMDRKDDKKKGKGTLSNSNRSSRSNSPFLQNVENNLRRGRSVSSKGGESPSIDEVNILDCCFCRLISLNYFLLFFFKLF